MYVVREAPYVRSGERIAKIKTAKNNSETSLQLSRIMIPQKIARYTEYMLEGYSYALNVPHPLLIKGAAIRWVMVNVTFAGDVITSYTIFSHNQVSRKLIYHRDTNICYIYLIKYSRFSCIL